LSDPNDPRVCIILSLTMDSPGRPPVTIDLSTKGAEKTLKEKPFQIKEGAKFTMSAKFKVQHEVLSGLQYVQVVKRKGIRVGKDQEMIVCFLLQYWVPIPLTICREAMPLTPTSNLSIPRNVSLCQHQVVGNWS
jgi:hypothetical protein